MRPSSVTVNANSDTGMRNKILEIRPPWEWVAEPEPDTRQRKADKAIAMAAADNEYGGETLFWARALFPILALSTSRHLAPPRPAAFKFLEEEAHEDTPLGMLRKFLHTATEPCSPDEASAPKAVLDAVRKELGKLDATVLASGGVGKAHRHKNESQSLGCDVGFLSMCSISKLKTANNIRFDRLTSADCKKAGR